jgi:hypothetical protein
VRQWSHQEPLQGVTSDSVAILLNGDGRQKLLFEARLREPMALITQIQMCQLHVRHRCRRVLKVGVHSTGR